MKITTSMLLHLLSKKHHIKLAGKEISIPIEHPALYCERANSNAAFYVVESVEGISASSLSAGCAYIICSCTTISPELLSPQAQCHCIAYTASEASIVLNDLFRAMRDILDWELRLTEAGMQKTDMRSLLELGHELVEAPLQLVDREYVYVAFTSDAFKMVESDPEFDKKIVPPHAIKELIRDSEFTALESYDTVFLYPSFPHRDRYICKNIFINGNWRYAARLLGEITVEPSQGLNELFDELSKHVSRLFSFYSNDILMKRQHDSMHELLRSMIFHHEDTIPQKTEDTLSVYGWDSTHQYTVVVLVPFDRRDFELYALYLCNQIEGIWQNSCAILCEGSIIWVVNSSVEPGFMVGSNKFSESFSPVIRDAMCKAGISDDFNSIYDIGVNVLKAKKALELGEIKNPHYWYYRFCDYVIDFIGSQATQIISREQLCHGGVKALVKYDKQNDTKYMSTLYHYIHCKFNVSAAADATFVHRTTFMRQLERICQISGIDFSQNVDMHQMLHILISFTLLGFTDNASSGISEQ